MLIQAQSKREVFKVQTNHNYDKLKITSQSFAYKYSKKKLERMESLLVLESEIKRIKKYTDFRHWEWLKGVVRRRAQGQEIQALREKKRALEEETRALEEETRAMEEETQALEEEIRPLEEETRALEMFLPWVKNDGKEALKRVEYVLEKRRVKPTDIKQHVEQLLKLMDQEYCQWLHNLNNCGTLLPSHEKIFKTMLEEIPKQVGMDQRLRLRYYITPGAQLSLDKILRLSSWTPSGTHNKNVRELLRDALLMLNDLGGNKEYHDALRDFMKRHTAFCAFILDNAYAITAEDSETTADLCKNLRRLAQNLGKIASTKAEQYQKLYENFTAHKEELSRWLDSASPGQGKFYFWFFKYCL